MYIYVLTNAISDQAKKEVVIRVVKTVFQFYTVVFVNFVTYRVFLPRKVTFANTKVSIVISHPLNLQDIYDDS